MKLETSLPSRVLVEKLELDAITESAVLELIRPFWEPSETVELTVEVDDDEAYDELEKADKLPEPASLLELLDGDELVDAAKALLDGDHSLAILLFARILGNDTDPQRRLEDMIRSHRRRSADAATAPAPRLVAA